MIQLAGLWPQFSCGQIQILEYCSQLCRDAGDFASFENCLLVILWQPHHLAPHSILEELAAHRGLRYLHRPANLEDVFLKLTGRELRE